MVALQYTTHEMKTIVAVSEFDIKEATTCKDTNNLYESICNYCIIYHYRINY